MIVYKAEDGKEYPAFCANPNKGGVENFAAKNYDVDVDGLDKDPHVWGAITNGWKTEEKEELMKTKVKKWLVKHGNAICLPYWV